MTERVKKMSLDTFTAIRGVVALAQINRLDGLFLAGPQTFKKHSSLKARLLWEKRQNAREQGEELPTFLN